MHVKKVLVSVTYVFGHRINIRWLGVLHHLFIFFLPHLLPPPPCNGSSSSPAARSVDKPQAARAMAWGVASEHSVDCSNIFVL